MKTKIILFSVLALLFAACNNNEPEQKKIIGTWSEPYHVNVYIKTITFCDDDTLDDPDKEGTNPPRPNNFHATINGNILSISIEEPAITSAQAVVTNNAGGTVINQSFSTVLVEPIANSGAYVLEIQTDGGSLMGFFNVQ